jgi:hypothetical protein
MSSAVAWSTLHPLGMRRALCAGPERRRQSLAGTPPSTRRPANNQAAVNRRICDALEELLILHLRSVSTGDFQEALTALLGKDAPNLLPPVMTRPTAEWQGGSTTPGTNVRRRLGAPQGGDLIMTPLAGHLRWSPAGLLRCGAEKAVGNFTTTPFSPNSLSTGNVRAGGRDAVRHKARLTGRRPSRPF